MVKFSCRPTRGAYFRSSRAQKRWKVLTHTGRPGASRSRRLRISSAALLVKVRARMCWSGTPSASSRAMRWVITRVLPLPGPARISRGPSRCSTASRWASVSPSRKSVKRRDWGLGLGLGPRFRLRFRKRHPIYTWPMAEGEGPPRGKFSPRPIYPGRDPTQIGGKCYTLGCGGSSLAKGSDPVKKN